MEEVKNVQSRNDICCDNSYEASITSRHSFVRCFVSLCAIAFRNFRVRIMATVIVVGRTRRRAKKITFDVISCLFGHIVSEKCRRKPISGLRYFLRKALAFVGSSRVRSGPKPRSGNVFLSGWCCRLWPT